jgi:hypothetical protein
LVRVPVGDGSEEEESPPTRKKSSKKFLGLELPVFSITRNVSGHIFEVIPLRPPQDPMASSRNVLVRGCTSCNSVADPDSGSRCLFDPWIRIRYEQPRNISQSLETIFWVKILKFFVADPGSRMEKIGIWDEYPGSATLSCRVGPL